MIDICGVADPDVVDPDPTFEKTLKPDPTFYQIRIPIRSENPDPAWSATLEVMCIYIIHTMEDKTCTYIRLTYWARLS